MNNKAAKLIMEQIFKSLFVALLMVLLISYLPMSFIALSMKFSEWYIWQRVAFGAAWIILTVVFFVDMPDPEEEPLPVKRSKEWEQEIAEEEEG